jgi:hypothetical protein
VEALSSRCLYCFSKARRCPASSSNLVVVMSCKVFENTLPEDAMVLKGSRVWYEQVMGSGPIDPGRSGSGWVGHKKGRLVPLVV